MIKSIKKRKHKEVRVQIGAEIHTYLRFSSIDWQHVREEGAHKLTEPSAIIDLERIYREYVNIKKVLSMAKGKKNKKSPFSWWVLW